MIGVQDDEASLRRFVKEGGWQFPAAILPVQVAASNGIRYCPTIVVIRPSGSIVKVLVGGASSAELNKMMDDLTG